jgi:hypothetical protein
MSDTPQHESHRRPHAPSMAEALMEFDLPAEVHRLHAETTWSTGQNARTLIKYDDFRVVLTALQAHIRVPEHKTEGRDDGLELMWFRNVSRGFEVFAAGLKLEGLVGMRRSHRFNGYGGIAW